MLKKNNLTTNNVVKERISKAPTKSMRLNFLVIRGEQDVGEDLIRTTYTVQSPVTGFKGMKK